MVRGEQPSTAERLGDRDREEPDRAASEDGDRTPCEVLRRCREDGVAERLLQARDLRRQLRAVVAPDDGRGHHDVVGEPAVAIDAEDLRLLAHVRLPGAAVEADAAGDVALGGHVVALLDVAHRAPGGNHRPAQLVPERERWPDTLGRPLIPAPDVQVGSADGGGLDPDEDLVLTGRRYRDLVERQARAGLALADRAHRLHAGDLATGEPAAGAGIRSRDAGAVDAAPERARARRALRQSTGAAPATGQRRRGDLRLPRRARRPWPARARDAQGARAHAAARAAGPVRGRPSARGRRAREPAPSWLSRRRRRLEDPAAPRPDQVPRRARRPLRRRLAHQERRRPAAQPLLAARDGGAARLARARPPAHGAHRRASARRHHEEPGDRRPDLRDRGPADSREHLALAPRERDGSRMVGSARGRSHRSRDRPHDLVARPPRRGAREPQDPALGHASRSPSSGGRSGTAGSRPRISRIASPSSRSRSRSACGSCSPCS